MSLRQSDIIVGVKLEDLQATAAVRGILSDALITVVSARWFGSDALELTYRGAGGELGSEILYRDDEARLEMVEQGRPWSFDGDGELFRLVSEALRIHLAHLFDPTLAVHTSLVEPLPHQITAACGSMRGVRWLDAGIMQSILAGIRLRPSFAVNVADPHQDLLPLTSGLLNFLAADEVDSWRVAIAADHHPRRGARAPGRHDRVTLPYLVPSEYVAEAVRAAEETVVDAGAESSHLSEDLAHAIRARPGTRLVRADAGQRLPPPEYGDYEGIHPMQSGSGYWIGMSAGTRPFRHQFLEQMCMRAARQGIGAVFTTCWRSLVLKNVAPEHLPEWRMLLGRHGVGVRHADAALHWQVCDRLPEARELAGTMIARLSRRSIVTSGLSFAVTDDPTRHEVAVAIQPLADERSLLSGLRRRYAVRHREGFDRHNPGWLTFARRLRERDLAPPWPT